MKKKEELRKEAEYITEERKAVLTFIKKERDKIRQEKENMRNQYTRDLDPLAFEREEFMNKMAREHDDWYGKIQNERANFLRDVKMQKRNLSILIEKRHEEIESYLKEREKSFEEEKNNELQHINALKEKAAKELEQISCEIRRIQEERIEISFDREQRNREWAELNNCSEELKVRREKLQKQRELLHVGRLEIYAQTEELKKLKDLKIVSDSDDIAIAELLNSDMESNQQKISINKILKQQTLTLDDHLNSSKEIDANKISNELDTSFAQPSSSVVSPPSAVQFSWIKRCTELIFRHSPEKLLIDNEDKTLVSDTFNVGDGQKRLTNDRVLDNVGNKHQMGFSFGEPKVILEVPTPSEDINRASDFKSGIKKDVSGSGPLLSDGCQMSRWKRASGNLTGGVGDPLLDTRQKKKLRPKEQPIENPLDQGTTCSAIPTQSDVSKVQQLLALSNQTLESTGCTRIVMVDKVMHVSEVISDKVDALIVLNQEQMDHPHNPTIGVDQCDLHGTKIDQ